MTTEVRRRSYRPGGWFGIFGDQASVLLPPSEKARVPGLWSLVDEGAGFDEVLDALLAGGLRDLPGFVLVSQVDQGTKVVLRGPAVAAFVCDGEMVELAGSFETTWVERTLSGVTQMFVQVEPTEEDGEDLTVASGLVRVARVEEPPYDPAEAVASSAALGAADDDTADPLTADTLDPLVGHEEPPIWEPLAEPEPLAENDAATAAEPVVDDVSPAPLAEPDLVVPPAPMGAFGAPPPAYPPPPPPSLDVAEPATAPLPQVADGATASGGWEPADFDRPQAGTTPAAPEAVGPPVARLLFSSGEVVAVDRVVLVGRAPEVRRFGAHDQPTLVTVPSPHQEISSTHLEVRPGAGIDYGSAVVTDLGSTNGTVLVQPGLPPEELQPGIAVQLVPGAIIDLGDGVTIQVTQA